MNIEHTKEIDRKNGNDYWMKALAKEMYDVGVAFEILSPGQFLPKHWAQGDRPFGLECENGLHA